jgi:hypothetical protein
MTLLLSFYFDNFEMYIIGGEVYDDEEVFGSNSYYASVYERDDDEYIYEDSYEDEYDQLAIALQNRLRLKNAFI